MALQSMKFEDILPLFIQMLKFMERNILLDLRRRYTNRKIK